MYKSVGLVMLHSEQFIADRIQQTHMFSSLDRQFADSVVVDHLRNAREWLAELSQNVAYCTGLRGLCCYLHMHEATTASVNSQHSNTLFYFTFTVKPVFSRALYFANFASLASSRK